ncbi:hypothetical protein [Pseudorhodoferax soli]|uniref:hypothetical protein n=1 Tax=Pseudorhodoferax soli TaxID=545864 RepID=UPI0014755A92|nr:hypothetical protein [Pseudorhodoferax soli]
MENLFRAAQRCGMQRHVRHRKLLHSIKKPSSMQCFVASFDEIMDRLTAAEVFVG